MNPQYNGEVIDALTLPLSHSARCRLRTWQRGVFAFSETRSGGAFVGSGTTGTGATGGTVAADLHSGPSTSAQPHDFDWTDTVFGGFLGFLVMPNRTTRRRL